MLIIIVVYIVKFHSDTSRDHRREASR